MYTTPLAVFGIGLAELLVIAAIALLTIFWVWMLVDCAHNETPGAARIFWVLLIVLIGGIGAPLYFLARKLPRKKK